MTARKGPSFHAALAHVRSGRDAQVAPKIAAPVVGSPKGFGDAVHPTRGSGSGSMEKRAEVEASLDPLERHAAQMAPPGFVVVAPVVAPVTTDAVPVVLRAASLETLLPALVKRIAWSAEGKDRGAVRMEIGAGELQGAVLLVQADAGEVKIHVSVPSGADREAWREKLMRRLDARGVRVASLEIE